MSSRKTLQERIMGVSVYLDEHVRPSESLYRSIIE
jgi:hypothetical protein